MGKEIEVKYLLSEDVRKYSRLGLLFLCGSLSRLEEKVKKTGTPIKQGYLKDFEIGRKIADSLDEKFDFEPDEIRLRKKGEKFYFTLKGEGGLIRNELEREISGQMFEKYWAYTEGSRVEKIRLAVPFLFYSVEIDVYTDRKLMVAEIEIPDTNRFLAGLYLLGLRLLPFGKDVSEAQKYKNKNLAK